jgi:phosphoglycerate dehydrogenase-like enzyme
MPRLRAVFHAAGTVKEHLTPAVWERGVTVTTAAAANSLPVAEYAVAMILLAGKGVLPIASMYRSDPSLNVARRFPGVGNYGRTVGIIGASTVGRLVIAMLASSDVQVLLYDPVITDDDPVLASARRVALDELFRRSLVVSIHAPLLPETRGLVGAAELAHLAPGSTLINTARAQIVDQVALQREVVSGRIFAVLDVTDPEPLPAGHVLLGLPGVFVTPHLAGALGNELLRLGECVVHEAESFVAGLAPRYPVLETDLTAMA